MLPELLSTDLCSLREKVDRFAVSVFWQLDENYDIVSVWFGRTLINSVHALSYEVAQKIVDGEKLEYSDYDQMKKEITQLLYIGR